MTRTQIHQIHQEERGFAGANANMSPSRRVGSSCASRASGQLGGRGTDGSRCLPGGGILQGWTPVVLKVCGCALLSALPPTYIPAWMDHLPPIPGVLQRAQGACALVLDTNGT